MSPRVVAFLAAFALFFLFCVVGLGIEAHLVLGSIGTMWLVYVVVWLWGYAP